MSRKFDRTQKVHAAAFDVLKGSIRMKPRWMPVFVWRPVFYLAAKIVFR